MMARIQPCMEKFMARSVLLYKFSVFSFYLLQKSLFPYDSDSDDDNDFASMYNTIPIADDIENIIPKLE
jgi:hypothetical protein